MKLHLKFQARRIELNVSGDNLTVSDLFRATELGLNISRNDYVWSFNGLYSEIIPADQPQASLASVGICNGDLIYLLPRDAMMQQLQEEPQSRPNLSPNNNAQLHSPSLRTPLVTQPSPKAFKSSVQSAASALPAPSTVNASGLDQELFKLRFNRDFEAWNSPTSLAADLESSLLPQINESLSSPYLYMFLFVHSMLLEIGLSFCQSSYPSGVDNSSATLGKQLTGTKSPSHTLSLTYILPAAVLPTSNSTSSSNVTQHQERASPNAGGRLVQLRMHQLGSFLTIIVFLDTDNHVRLDLNLSGTFYSQSSASCDVQVPHECSICAVGVRRTESTEAALRDRVQVLPIGRSSGRQWFAVAGEGRLYALRVALIDRLYLPVRAIVRRANGNAPEHEDVCGGGGATSWTSAATLLSLHRHALVHMARFLDARSVQRLASTCRRMRELTPSDALSAITRRPWRESETACDAQRLLWRPVCIARFPPDQQPQSQLAQVTFDWYGYYLEKMSHVPRRATSSHSAFLAPLPPHFSLSSQWSASSPFPVATFASASSPVGQFMTLADTKH